MIRFHNSYDRRQIYHKSNSARNHTINERTLAISVSIKNCNKVIETKNKALNIFEGLFITVMTPLARFVHKYDKLNRKMKLHKKYIKLKDPTIRFKNLMKLYFFYKVCEIFEASSGNL